MTSKIKANNAMEELENAIIHLAQSAGIEPGTDEFEAMVRARIAEPEARTMKHLRGQRAVYQTENVISSVDNKYVNFIFLKSLNHWCHVNRGMMMENAARILQIDHQRIKFLGRQATLYGLPDFSKLLDGSDDRTDCSMDPDEII